ncbi:phosphotransferase enzyme family protein [Aestuariivirga sp.]|uniref:phosphotransferase enzyme family protein n=1 Tax=Aestuariivirga sp. TaxID=2650926 RepID=UPI0039E6144E
MADFDTLPHDRQLPLLLELAEAATGLYALPAGLKVNLVNLSENATYKVEAPDGRRWALRIHRDGYHSRTAIASELAWLMDLRRTGVVTTPAPVKGRDGEIIQQLGHATMPRPRNIVLFDWETGAEPGIGEDLAEPFEVLGEVTARMHLHTRNWTRPPWFERLTWDFETSLGEDKPHWGRWRDGMGVDASKQKLFGRTVDLIGRRLAAYGKSQDRFGLIHCDLRLANLLIDGKDVKVIDFDDCGFGWYMYDAATPVSFYEHEPQVPGLIESWKKGYRRVIPLSREDEAEIPTFVMLRRLLLVAWIGSHSETDLAKSMGLPYTEGTVGLCEDYLRRFG